MDFGTYLTSSAWPEDHLLPEGGGELVLIFRFWHRLENEVKIRETALLEVPLEEVGFCDKSTGV